jgi:hypothetical protein
MHLACWRAMVFSILEAILTVEGSKNGVVVGTISPGGRGVRKWEVRQVTRNVGEVCADGVERRHTVIHFEAKVELTKHN